MTYKELLGRLDDYGSGVPVVSALRAVVEFHKGQSTGECGEPDCCGEADFICAQCQVDYPCPTIQAIEKELS